MGILNLDPNGDLILNVVQSQSPATTKRILVSSQIMTLASPVFDAMLNGHFRESQLQLSKFDPPTLDIQDSNTEAMVILCQILHHHKGAKELVSPQRIVAVAILGDMYDCQSTTEFWFHFQLLQRPELMNSKSLGEILFIIQAALLFNASEVFYDATKSAVQYISFKWAPTNAARALNDTLPSGLQDAIRTAQAAQIELLGARCKNLIHDLVGNDHLKDPCTGQAKRLARLTTTLCYMGLWNVQTTSTGRLADLCVSEAIDFFECAFRWQVPLPNNMKCRAASCSKCAQDWEAMIKDKLTNSLDKVHGFCLTCVKTHGQKFTEIAAVKCDQHQTISKPGATHSSSK